MTDSLKNIFTALDFPDSEYLVIVMSSFTKGVFSGSQK